MIGHPTDCGCCTPERLDRLVAAREAADVLLANAGITLAHKATLDLSTPRGFDRALALMASDLRRSAVGAERNAVRDAVAGLDVDWPNTTKAQRRQLVDGAMRAAGRALENVGEEASKRISTYAEDAFKSGRRNAIRQGARGASAAMTDEDRALATALEATNGFYITDAMGRRVEVFGERALALADAGLEAGENRNQIRERLQGAADATLGRSGNYWEVVAAAFLSRASNAAHLHAYNEAGIEFYRLIATMDEATTLFCRLANDQLIRVADGMAQVRRVAGIDRQANPGAIRQVAPWVQQGRDAQGRTILYIDRDGTRQTVAVVTRNAMGNRDDAGEFEEVMSAQQRVDSGLGMPPFHGLCRTITVPDFGGR